MIDKAFSLGTVSTLLFKKNTSRCEDLNTAPTFKSDSCVVFYGTPFVDDSTIESSV